LAVARPEPKNSPFLRSIRASAIWRESTNIRGHESNLGIDRFRGDAATSLGVA
jgi:hypothetical protein